MLTPLTWAPADHRCAFTIRTAGLSDSTHWENVWVSAVALAGLCARQGMQGREIQLGKFVDFVATSRSLQMLFIGDDHHLATFLTDPAIANADLS